MNIAPKALMLLWNKLVGGDYMGYASDYFAIRDEIRNLIDTDVDPALSDIQEIIFGEKLRVGELKFPCIFIVPGKSGNEDMEMPNEQQFVHPFSLVIVLKNQEIETGLNHLIAKAGRLFDLFMKEKRDLNGKCLYVTVRHIDPGYGQDEQSKAILHWCEVYMEVTVLI